LSQTVIRSFIFFCFSNTFFMNPVLKLKYQTNRFMVEALIKFPPHHFCPTAVWSVQCRVGGGGGGEGSHGGGVGGETP
jgi:hypothetical protein